MLTDRRRRRAEELLDLTELAARAHRWNAVRRHAREVLEIDPYNPDARQLLDEANAKSAQPRGLARMLLDPASWAYQRMYRGQWFVLLPVVLGTIYVVALFAFVGIVSGWDIIPTDRPTGLQELSVQGASAPALQLFGTPVVASGQSVTILARLQPAGPERKFEICMDLSSATFEVVNGTARCQTASESGMLTYVWSLRPFDDTWGRQSLVLSTIKTDAELLTAKDEGVVVERYVTEITVAKHVLERLPFLATAIGAIIAAMPIIVASILSRK